MYNCFKLNNHLKIFHQKYKKNLFGYLVCLLLLLNGISTYAQIPIYEGVKVSDIGVSNSIGSANTSRNIAVSKEGAIYIVYRSDTDIRFSKSIDSGQSFLPSILISTINNTTIEPEIAVNDMGIIFIAWNDAGNVTLSSSNNNGNSFNTPRVIGTQDTSADKYGIHISTFESNLFLVDESGANLYINRNNGNGQFSRRDTDLTLIYTDILTDKEGKTYLSADNPNLHLFTLSASYNSFTEITINPLSIVYYSNHTLSDNACGTFIFVAGRGTDGFKINVETGESTRITFNNNAYSSDGVNYEGRTLYANNENVLVDGYKNAVGELMISISYNQGETFELPVIVDVGESHNVTINPSTNDIAVVYEKAGEIYLSVYESLSNKITIPEITPPVLICENRDFSLPFTLLGRFDVDTEFVVVLSDKNGNFDNLLQIGSIITSSDNTINCTVPEGLSPSSDYKIKVISSSNCIQSNFINIDIQNPVISGEFELFKGDTTTLTGTGTPNILSSWISSNPSVASIDFQGNLIAISAGTTSITYTNDKGCSTAVTIFVAYHPSFFTPNGDGINDEWTIVGLGNNEFKVSIFDRYGKLLKIITQNDSGWNGNYQGNSMPPNDYWFQLEYLKSNDTVPKIIIGHFSLIK